MQFVNSTIAHEGAITEQSDYGLLAREAIQSASLAADSLSCCVEKVGRENLLLQRITRVFNNMRHLLPRGGALFAPVNCSKRVL